MARRTSSAAMPDTAAAPTSAGDQGPGQRGAQMQVGRDVQHQLGVHGIARRARRWQREHDAPLVRVILILGDVCAERGLGAIDLQHQGKIRAAIEEIA